MARVEATGWVSGNYYNQDWGGRFNDDNNIVDVTWGASVYPWPAYLPRIPVNPHAAKLRVHNDFLRHSRQEFLWRQFDWRNTLVNPWVHHWGQEKYGPVTQ